MQADRLEWSDAKARANEHTRPPGQAVAQNARSRRAGICGEVQRLQQIPDSLGKSLGFRDDG